MSEIVQAYDEEGEVIMSYLSMFRVNEKGSRGLEVPLKALWRKATGGGGRLRQATAREEKSRERRTKEAREEEARREDLST